MADLDPEIGEGGGGRPQKKFFQPFRPQFGGARGAQAPRAGSSPGS